MSEPKPLYYATISYYTPSGRKVLFSATAIAADTLEECKATLLGRLDNQSRYGRRKVARVSDDFSATYIGHQIATR